MNTEIIALCIGLVIGFFSGGLYVYVQERQITNIWKDIAGDWKRHSEWQVTTYNKIIDQYKKTIEELMENDR